MLSENISKECGGQNSIGIVCSIGLKSPLNAANVVCSNFGTTTDVYKRQMYASLAGHT